MGRVDAKIVVVTGAAGGQGAAEVRAVATEGATDVKVPRRNRSPALKRGEDSGKR
jgi:NADP-dependent 3-hydroxy acid dehydrogenase YdfG